MILDIPPTDHHIHGLHALTVSTAAVKLASMYAARDFWHGRCDRSGIGMEAHSRPNGGRGLSYAEITARYSKQPHRRVPQQVAADRCNLTEGGVYVLRIHAMHLRRKVDDLTVQAEMLTGAMEFEKLHPTFDDPTLRVTGSRIVKRNMGDQFTFLRTKSDRRRSLVARHWCGARKRRSRLTSCYQPFGRTLHPRAMG